MVFSNISLKLNEFGLVDFYKLDFNTDDIKKLGVFYQPIVSLQNAGDTKPHIEALTRVLGHDKKIIMPGDFFSRLKEKNDHVEVDKHIINNVFSDISDNKLNFGNDYQVNINISAQGIEKYDVLIPFIENIRIYYQIKSNNICFEINEESRLNKDNFISNILDLDYKLAFDDFEAGRCGVVGLIGHLDKIKINKYKDVTLKADMEFVNFYFSEKNRFVYDCMFNLINHIQKTYLGLEVVAEGIVEGDKGLILEDSLVNLGSDYGQGFLYSKAIPIGEYFSRKNEFINNSNLDYLNNFQTKNNKKNVKLSNTEILIYDNPII